MKINDARNKKELLYIHNKLYFWQVRWKLFALYLKFAKKHKNASIIIPLYKSSVDIINQLKLILLYILKYIYSNSQDNIDLSTEYRKLLDLYKDISILIQTFNNYLE